MNTFQTTGSDDFQIISMQTDGSIIKTQSALKIDGIGCVLKSTTEKINKKGSIVISESMLFIPYVTLADGDNGGKKIVDWTIAGTDGTPSTDAGNGNPPQK